MHMNFRRIPLILRYPKANSFERLFSKEKEASGSYASSFTAFSKVYRQIRLLFFLFFMMLCLMVFMIILQLSN